MSAPHPDFPDEYYHDADLRIVQAVPADALDILDVACGEGRLGEVLKHLQPGRRVTGVEKRRDVAELAGSRLDAVLIGDIERDALPLDAESFDCIVAGETLAQCTDPQAALERLRPLLRPGGHLIAALPNLQHWSRIDGLLRGEARSPDGDIRTFAVADIVRIFLDAGFLPRIADRRSTPAPADWLAAMLPTAARQGLDAATFAARTQTWQYFIAARPIADLPTAPEVPPVTVGACTNDPVALRENLLASPCLQSVAHETLMVEGATSAAEGLNAIIAQAQHELVVLAHQDVYLPGWWIARLWQQYEKARVATGGKVGVMGVYGVLGTPGGIQHNGRVADRDFLLDEPTPLPTLAGSLDELVLIVPKSTPLRFDPALGFHLYGTDICLAAENLGLHGMVIDAPCFHNSKQGNELPAAFSRSKAVLRGKWSSRLPIATPCVTVF